MADVLINKRKIEEPKPKPKPITISDTIRCLQRRKNALDRDILPDAPSWPEESDYLERAIEGLKRLQMYERRRLYIFEGKKERRKWM